MNIVEDLYDYKNHKIRIEAHDGVYEGILWNVCADVRKVSLMKVVMVEPQQVSFYGLQSFYPRDIKSYKVLSKPEDKKKSSAHDNQQNGIVPTYGCSSAPLKIMLDDVSDVESDSAAGDSDSEGTPENKEEEYTLVLPAHLEERLPIDHTIIDAINEDFYHAIRHINKQEVIGVSFEGSNIGRFGKLCWIGISTMSCTFLFDIMALEVDGFSKGLRHIMESSVIMKVIHDCRLPSDALFHKYSTCLENVYDTQLADAFVNMQYSKLGKIPNEVNSLYTCAKRYLELGVGDIYPEKARRSVFSDVVCEWTFRPISNEFCDRAIKNVIYLTVLRDELLRHMLSSYYKATQTYLNVVRNASQKELDLEPSVPYLLPQALLTAGLRTVQIKEFATSKECRLSDNRTHKKFEKKNSIDKFLKYLKENDLLKSPKDQGQTSAACKESSSQDNKTAVSSKSRLDASSAIRSSMFG